MEDHDSSGSAQSDFGERLKLQCLAFDDWIDGGREGGSKAGVTKMTGHRAPRRPTRREAGLVCRKVSTPSLS